MCSSQTGAADTSLQLRDVSLCSSPAEVSIHVPPHLSRGTDDAVLQVAVPFPTTAISQQLLHTNQQVSSIGLLLADAQQVKPLLH